MLPNNLITCDPEILSGTPVFTGTRVPVQTLFDYLEDGEPLDVFLDNFPSVTRQQAQELVPLMPKVIDELRMIANGDIRVVEAA